MCFILTNDLKFWTFCLWFGYFVDKLTNFYQIKEIIWSRLMSRSTETSWGEVDDVAFVSLFKLLSLLLTCCAINIHVNGHQRLMVILFIFFFTVELKASAEALLFVRVIKSLRMSRESIGRLTKWLCESLIISSVCLTENQRNIYSESHGGLSPEPAEAPFIDQSQPSQSGKPGDWLAGQSFEFKQRSLM